MRLDLFLFENGYTSSRAEAKAFILAGAVSVGGRIILKPAFDFTSEQAEIILDKSDKKYVSRGGLKLEGAISEFKIDVKSKLALDVGASSGGFTDCLLQNGARHVIAVDSGSGQMVEKLRLDERVTVRENFNARYMSRDDFEYAPEVAVMDVSFISATYIIPAIYEVLDSNADFICLIKPQFEVGRAYIGKGGVVKDERARKMAIDKVVDSALGVGFELLKIITSPITGGDGNVEFLAHFRKTLKNGV